MTSQEVTRPKPLQAIRRWWRWRWRWWWWCKITLCKNYGYKNAPQCHVIRILLVFVVVLLTYFDFVYLSFTIRGNKYWTGDDPLFVTKGQYKLWRNVFLLNTMWMLQLQVVAYLYVSSLLIKYVCVNQYGVSWTNPLLATPNTNYGCGLGCVWEWE